jgi:hypothetical protein
MGEMRSRQEIDELERTMHDTLEVLRTEPMKLVKATGGAVPGAVSNMQVILTNEVLSFGELLAQWVRGEDNHVLEVAKASLEKLKGIQL